MPQGPEHSVTLSNREERAKLSYRSGKTSLSFIINHVTLCQPRAHLCTLKQPLLCVCLCACVLCVCMCVCVYTCVCMRTLFCMHVHVSDFFV